MSYSIVNDLDQFALAMALAKGTYQQNILRGTEALSGATLKGKARKYSGRYKESSANLIRRCQAAGIKVSELRGQYGKRTLVIG